jgi:hypothetical protein
MGYLDDFAASLGYTARELALLDWDAITIKVPDAMTADDRFRLRVAHASVRHELTALPPPPPPPPPPPIDGTNLASYLEGSERRRVQPWRAQEDAGNRSIEATLKGTSISREDAKAAYVDRARSALISPADALVACYRWFADDAGKEFYDQLLFHTDDGPERVATHNWYVAKRLGEAFVNKHGATIATLPWPLFGWDNAFSALNTKILAEAAAPHGAGPLIERHCSVFRHTPTGGAFPVPVQTTSDGQAYVDLGPADDAVRAIRKEMAQMQRTLAAEIRSLRLAMTPAPRDGRNEQRRGGQRNAPRNGNGRGRGQPLGGEEHATGPSQNF